MGQDGALYPLPALVLVLLIDCATGLAALHERNIVHGDLKTDNVLLKVCGHFLVGAVPWRSKSYFPEGSPSLESRGVGLSERRSSATFLRLVNLFHALSITKLVGAMQ